MRADLAKCTTERERAGAKGKCYKNKYRGKVRIHPDPEHDYLNEYGGFRSSARHRHWESKSFTDFLSPLIGAIRKNVGRPWDKVFSEFCQVLDRRGISGYHIWTHLRWEVKTNTYIGVDGNVYAYSHRGGNPSRVNGEFYVHPVTGILCWEPRDKSRDYWPRRNEEKKPVKVIVDNEWYYELIDGLWFHCHKVEKIDPFFGRKYFDIKKFSANKKEIAWVKTRS